VDHAVRAAKLRDLLGALVIGTVKVADLLEIVARRRKRRA
jgi:hypothetical protein